MRFAALLVTLVLAAGCVGGPAPGEPVSPAGGGAPADADGNAAPPTPSPTPGEPASNAPPGNQTPPSEGPQAAPTFCESESACDFWDDLYHEYVLYEVDTASLDVLIVPSASPDTAGDTPILRAAAQAWAEGIRELGHPWFAEGLQMRVYVLGEDTPPQSALDDPEILILAAEYNPAVLFGIGYQLPALPCRGAAKEMYAGHSHDGAAIRAADCEAGGYTCAAINTNFLQGDAHQLHDLVTHELGHCLGGGHVGDALDFSAKLVPVADIMSYQHDAAQVHCVSNLNVRTLEGLYAPLLAATAEMPLAPGEYLAMKPEAYAQVRCANP